MGTRRGGSNEYPQSLFLNKNKKHGYTPAYLSFFHIKVGFEGVYIARQCFPDDIKKIYSNKYFFFLLKKKISAYGMGIFS